MPRASAASVAVIPAKKRSLTKAAAWGVHTGEVIESFVNRKYQFVRSGAGEAVEVQRLPFGLSAALAGCSPTRPFDENAAHGFGGRGEEMTAAVPRLFSGR